MAWYSSGVAFPSVNFNWINANIAGATALSVKSTYPTSSVARLIWKEPIPSNPNIFYSRDFDSDKNYLFRTTVRKLSYVTSGMSFSISPAWNDAFLLNNTTAPIPSLSSTTLYHHSSPDSQVFSSNYATYRANGLFGTATSLTNTPGVVDIQISELNWKVNGYMYCDDGQVLSVGSSSHTLGWRYIDSTTQSAYMWFDDANSTYYPVGGLNAAKIPSDSYRSNNFITKFVNFQFFNFYFNYEKLAGLTNEGIKIYISDVAPPVTTFTSSFNSFTSSTATLLADINDFGQVDGSFFGLQGNRYVTIVGPQSASYSLFVLSNINIEGGYHPGNNQLYSMSLPNINTNINGATYSAFVGNGNTINATSSLVVNKIFSKVGNGKFNSGTWENGVWNNGWRKDEIVKDFDNIDLSIRSVSDSRWRWRMIGPSASVEQFNIGDVISIGNIVAIDINEERKLLKSSFQIIAASASGINDRIGYITVEADTTFPYLRIERDSPNHKIKVTKNIWLSGAFLNGYFTGVWNYGLFRGYPLITEMNDSHWIDGKFEGGHFKSTNISYPDFVDTVYSSNKVGLTFSAYHGLAVGDIIKINKTDKSINPQYDGETTVIEVPNDKLVITDLDWGQNSNSESGQITTTLASGVLQNISFKSNNVSKITSNTSLDTDAVFIYNSWMDLYYDETSASNIGKPQTLINSISNKSYSENNLYGYVTNDVLSSSSLFRDSFSLVSRSYKLGTKYKIFSDYIGDSGNFENYFNPAGTNSNAQTFLDQGWTYSWLNTTSVTFSRTTDIGQQLITGKELKVEAIGSGGILDIQNPTINVNNRLNSEIEKNRYTVVEFDLVTYSVNSTEFENTQNPYTFGKFSGYKGNNIIEPIIHFNNVNYITREIAWPFGTYNTQFPSTFLPIYQNINFLETPNKRKVEYFYNKRNLSMHFKGSGLYGASQSSFIIDNLNLFEIDMIPFFKYFTTENINIGVQVPLQGIAPFIDYSDSNFVFLDNINIGLDSFDVTQQYDLYSGVGLGIGSSVTGVSIANGLEATGIFEAPQDFLTTG
jgi:hypothetical protein